MQEQLGDATAQTKGVAFDFTSPHDAGFPFHGDVAQRQSAVVKAAEVAGSSPSVPTRDKVGGSSFLSNLMNS